MTMCVIWLCAEESQWDHGAAVIPIQKDEHAGLEMGDIPIQKELPVESGMGWQN